MNKYDEMELGGSRSLDEIFAEWKTLEEKAFEDEVYEDILQRSCLIHYRFERAELGSYT